MQMKELFILRHAEAVSAKYNTSDFDIIDTF